MQVFKQWPIYLIGRILPAAIGFFGIALYTRLLDPASFGIYALPSEAFIKIAAALQVPYSKSYEANSLFHAAPLSPHRLSAP